MKIFLKILSVLLVVLVLAGIGYLLTYQSYPEFQMYIKTLDIKTISENTTLRMLTRISKPDQGIIISDINSDSSLEHITPELLAQYQNNGTISEALEPLDTHLSVPSTNIAGKVVDGEDSTGMDRGFWHFPLSKAPGEKGNFIVIAHRFLHIPPRTDTFFNLDKIKVGDKIIIKQRGATFTYTVIETKVVEKNDRTILSQSNDYRITLVTCTPLWTANQRHVVIGKLDKIYNSI